MASSNVTRFMAPILNHYTKNYKNTYLVIRGDSGFAMPKLCNRGTMENFIKEAKLDFGMETLSHSSYLANANRMMQMVLAYNLNNLMRRLCFSNADKPKRMHTLRTVLTKLAGRFIQTGRYSTFKLCSSYPYKEFFVKLFDQINLLPSFG